MHTLEEFREGDATVDDHLLNTNGNGVLWRSDVATRCAIMAGGAFRSTKHRTTGNARPFRD